MSKVLKRVVLAEVTEDKVVGKYLNTADEELIKIEEKIEFPSNRRLKEINDLGIFDNSKRFSIEELTNRSPLQAYSCFVLLYWEWGRIYLDHNIKCKKINSKGQIILEI